jgi:hypothetical protein
LRVCYSAPDKQDVCGTDYDVGHQITVDFLKAQLPSSNFEFYICGPPGMMADMTQGLKAWGVPESKIFTEAFGPASVAKTAPSPSPTAPGTGTGATPGEAAGTAHTAKIAFARSGRSVTWDPLAGNLLTFSQTNGIEIPFGCCAGNCGTCETAIKSGAVRYLRQPGWKAQAGTCLVCVCAPDGDVELDA